MLMNDEKIIIGVKEDRQKMEQRNMQLEGSSEKRSGERRKMMGRTGRERAREKVAQSLRGKEAKNSREGRCSKQIEIKTR